MAAQLLVAALPAWSAHAVAAPVLGRHAAWCHTSPSRPRVRALVGCAEPVVDELATLPEALAAVLALSPTEGVEDGDSCTVLWEETDHKAWRFKVSGLQTCEPSFTRLFTHATWADYTGQRFIILFRLFLMLFSSIIGF